jgi:predicted nucleotidyltransferase component of viral defense system
MQVFQEIFSDSELTAQLVFKGGSCLMMFYGIDRFSTDLDFDVRLGASPINADRISNILSEHLTLGEHRDKFNTLFWLARYEAGQRNLKVEISKRDFPQKTLNKDYYGLTVATMAPEQMLAHKLCAISERKKNRDLYDAWFMLNKNWDIDEDIIKIRQGGKSTKEYLRELVSKLQTPKMQKNILNELGEVLTEERKRWVKEHLVDALIRQLRMRMV